MSIFTNTNTLNLLMLRRQVGPNDPRVSDSNPGGSGVEFWHQADFLIIWNSIRAPPSSWVTRTCQCSRQGSVTPRGGSIQIMSTLHLPGPGIEPQTDALTLCIFTT